MLLLVLVRFQSPTSLIYFNSPPQPFLAAACHAVALADTSPAPDPQARFPGYPNPNDKKDIFTPIVGRNYAPIPKSGAPTKPTYNGHKIQARDSSAQLYHEQVSFLIIPPDNPTPHSPLCTPAPMCRPGKLPGRPTLPLQLPQHHMEPPMDSPPRRP